MYYYKPASPTLVVLLCAMKRSSLRHIIHGTCQLWKLHAIISSFSAAPVVVTNIATLIRGLEHFLFSHMLGMIIPIDFHIFQRG